MIVLNMNKYAVTVPFAVAVLISVVAAQEACSESGSIRLVNGAYPAEGRVELCYSGTWGTVCDDEFDYQDAKVVCRQLGYDPTKAQARTSGFYGPGTGTIWLSDLICRGNEPRLLDCQASTELVEDFCNHSEDTGVICDDTESPLPRCNVTLTDVGTLTSPMYPSNYLPYLFCNYLIQAPEGHTIELKFSTFDVELQSYCLYDSVKVYDGNSPESEQIGVFCGEDLPPSIVSTNSSVLIIFRTDDDEERTGFSADYRFIAPPTTPTTPATTPPPLRVSEPPAATTLCPNPDPIARLLDSVVVPQCEENGLAAFYISGSATDNTFILVCHGVYVFNPDKAAGEILTTEYCWTQLAGVYSLDEWSVVGIMHGQEFPVKDCFIGKVSTTLGITTLSLLTIMQRYLDSTGEGIGCRSSGCMPTSNIREHITWNHCFVISYGTSNSSAELGVGMLGGARQVDVYLDGRLSRCREQVPPESYRPNDADQTCFVALGDGANCQVCQFE